MSKEPDFFDKPSTVTWILRIFYTLCVLLVVADFIVHRHIYIWFETLPTFYALYGFVACVLLVLLAKVMRLGLMRNEDYYDPYEQEQAQDDAMKAHNNSATRASHKEKQA